MVGVERIELSLTEYKSAVLTIGRYASMVGDEGNAPSSSLYQSDILLLYQSPKFGGFGENRTHDRSLKRRVLTN